MSEPSVSAPRASAQRILGRIRALVVRRWEVLLLLAVTVLPLLFVRSGVVGADTRQTALVDPGRFIGRAWSLWDDAVHLGTVTHQNVGLIFPFATFYWLGHLAGLPVWVVQRLWLGGILFAAGMGVRYLLVGRGWKKIPFTVAAVAYALTPYTLQYGNRMSVLLVPFSGLPWLIAAFDRGARRGGWRMPALAGFVCLLAGGGNATALLMMMLGGALWLVTLVVSREQTLRRVWATTWRAGVLCAGASVWWLVVLSLQSKFGLNVLTYTESLEAVTSSPASHEVLRGLGYWLFYGSELGIPNVAGSSAYLTSPVGLVLSFGLAGLSLLGAAFMRGRERLFVLLAIGLGVSLAVAVYPYSHAGPLGTLLHDHDTNSLVLMFRSATRITPLVVLALAMGLGSLVQNALVWLGQRPQRARRQGARVWQAPVAVAAVVLALVANLPSMYTGNAVDPNLARPETLPSYWSDAAKAIDTGSTNRVLVLPGQPYSTYRWGITYEPVLPGMTDRSTLQREQLPFGAPGGATLLVALDSRLHDAIAEPRSFAAVARLLGADQLLVEYDQNYERYLTARPRWLAQYFATRPFGLGAPTLFGEGYDNQSDPARPLLDEFDLQPGDSAIPAALVLYPVDDPQPIVSLHDPGSLMLLAGDGDGVVDSAAVGLLDGAQGFREIAAMTDAELIDGLRNGSTLVVTDSNRRRIRRWRSVKSSVGPTLRGDQDPSEDAFGDAPLEVFPDQTTADQTVALDVGATVNASVSGGPLFLLTPETRPAGAFDGDPATDWSVGPAKSSVGEWIEVTAPQPLRTTRIRLLQRQAQPRYTTISSVRLTFDGTRTQDVTLDDSSLVGGQWVTVADEPFTTLRVTPLSTATEPGYEYFQQSPQGFSEIEVPGLSYQQVVRVPTRGLDRISADTPVSLVLTRARSNPADTTRDDEERSLVREFTLPMARNFALSGQLRLSATADPALVDAIVGLPDGLAAATASSELPGYRASRPSAAFDGDANTSWQSTVDGAAGSWLEARWSAPRTLSMLDLQLVTDGRHSVPTSATLDVDGTTVTVPLPEVPAASATGLTHVQVPVDVPSGRTLRLTFGSIAPTTTREFLAGGTRVLPVGVAEWVAGAANGRTEPTLGAECRDDLVAVDGTAVPVRVRWTAAMLLAGEAGSIEACDPLDLADGTHVVQGVNGDANGLVVDRVLLMSGGVRRAAAPTAVTATRESASHWVVQVPGRDAPQMLVLAESFNEGWHATVDGHDLGAPSLVNGYANGWLLPAGSDRTVELTWEPQRTVTIALSLSGATGLLCVGLLAFGRRRAAAPPLDEPRRIEPEWRQMGRAHRVAAVLSGLVGWAMLGGPGMLLAVATLLAARRVRWATLLRAASVAAVAVSFGLVLIGQARDAVGVNYGWTNRFHDSHWLALTAVLVLAATALGEAVAVESIVAEAGDDELA